MNLRRRRFSSRGGVSEVLGALMLMLVVVVAVGAFAFYLSAAQKQAEQRQSFQTNVNDDDLKIKQLSFFPNNILTQFQFNATMPPITFTVGTTVSTTTVSDAGPDTYVANAYAGGTITFGGVIGYTGAITSNTAATGTANTGVFTFAPALTTVPTPGAMFTVTPPQVLFYITENPVNLSEVTIQNGTDNLGGFPWASPYALNVAIWNAPLVVTAAPNGMYSEINTGSYTTPPCLESPTANTGYPDWSLVFGAACTATGDFPITATSSVGNYFESAVIDFFTLRVLNFNVEQSGLSDIEVNGNWVGNLIDNGIWNLSLPLPLPARESTTVTVDVNAFGIFENQSITITLASSASNYFTSVYENPSAIITETLYTENAGSSHLIDMPIFSGQQSTMDPNASIALYSWTVAQYLSAYTSMGTTCPPPPLASLPCCPTMTTPCTAGPITSASFEFQEGSSLPTEFQNIDGQYAFTVTLIIQDTNGLTSNSTLVFPGDTNIQSPP